MFRRKSSWIGIGLSLVFLALFLYRVPFRDFLRELKQANYLYIIPAILVYFVGVWVRAVRWRFLLRSLGKFPPHRLFSPIVVGFAINNILPARVGLIARAYLLGVWEGISKIGSGATVAVDQLFDGMALLVFLGVVARAVPWPPDLAKTIELVALVAGIVFLGFFVLFLVLALSPRITHWLVGKFTGRLPQKWQPGIKHGVDMTLEGLASLRRPDRLAIAFLLSLAVWAIEAAMYYIVSLSFGLHQPFYVMLLLVSIANIAITPPSLPGGIGPFEYFGKLVLIIPAFGVSAGVATAYMAVLHATVLLPVTLLGLVLLALKRTSLSEAVGGIGASQ